MCYFCFFKRHLFVFLAFNVTFFFFSFSLRMLFYVSLLFIVVFTVYTPWYLNCVPSKVGSSRSMHHKSTLQNVLMCLFKKWEHSWQSNVILLKFSKNNSIDVVIKKEWEFIKKSKIFSSMTLSLFFFQVSKSAD